MENALVQVSRQTPVPECCGGRMQNRGQRLITVETLFGPVPVPRTRDRCGCCGRESYPGDREWCSGRHRITRPLAKRICQLATLEHFPRLPRLLLEQHGLQLGRETMLELVHDVGRVAEAERRAAAQTVRDRATVAAREIVPRVQPERLDISCDGIMYCTNQTEPVAGKPGQKILIWQLMKVGCVAWHDAQGHWQKQVLWGRESPEEFGAALFELACRCGSQQAREVIFAADGGAWCWEIRDRYFPAAQDILD